MSRLAVIVTGSRDWTSEAPIAKLVAGYPSSTVVIHGACRGADRAAGKAAWRRGLQVVAMPAQWQRLGRAAGTIRNQHMLDVLVALSECGYRVAVHAFPLPGSKGTRHMMEIAGKAGIEVIDYSGGPGANCWGAVP